MANPFSFAWLLRGSNAAAIAAAFCAPANHPNDPALPVHRQLPDGQGYRCGLKRLHSLADFKQNWCRGAGAGAVAGGGATVSVGRAETMVVSSGCDAAKVATCQTRLKKSGAV